MTAQATVKNRLRQPWLIRRIFYFIMAAVGIIAAIFFGASAEQITSVEGGLEPVLSILLSVVSGLAASRANPGSDMGAIPAPAPAPAPAPEPQALDLREIAATVAATVVDYLGAPGAHRADASESLDSLRASLAVGSPQE